MQTSLARRQRHRRAIQQRPKGGGGSSVVRRIVIAIPIIAAVVLLSASFTGLVIAVGVYNQYSQGLPDPRAALTDIGFEQQTIVYDRTGTIELARLGHLRREVVTFEQLPGEILDATTAIEDKDFWINAGYDPIGIVSAGLDTISGRPRGASTITQQLVRARLLPPESFEGETWERKLREIIQSVRLTDAFPGEEGKREIITAYLNQNFYGNQTYGVKAAARGYFGKELWDLSLAQYAILAAIPQSPTKFDLVKNAEHVCLEDIAEDDECPNIGLVVAADTEIVQRRNYVLDLMKTRSPLTGARHTKADYEAAKLEPVILRQQVSATWKAPHFVWQVRRALGETLCPDTPDSCALVDTGGYRVVTSLDWEMQKVTEKWVYAAARLTHTSDPRASFKKAGIPTSAYGWLVELRGRNIHNGAAAVMDYRTGEILAYVGSASYTSQKTKKFQPRFDVLADGWRQPGSSIKPIDYAIGIDDGTLTAATMFMDVTTDFGNKYIPTQADGLERGPVRVRGALQFSLNIPAIKSTLIMGLEHVLNRTKDFGLRYQRTAIPVTSMGIGTLETHPIDMLTAYSTIANGGVREPRTLILTIDDADGRPVWNAKTGSAAAEQVISAQAAYVITDILAGNTVKTVNPYWAEWAIFDGTKRRQAAYKTGTTNENRDVHAYGYVAPPNDPDAPALAVGVWMGNSDNDPNKGSLSLDSSAPLWSAILTEVSEGMPFAKFSPPPGIEKADVDAFTGLKHGPFTTRTVEELFVEGSVPTQKETLRVALDIDQASGLLWQEGCIGPMVTRGFFALDEVETNFPNWQKANKAWGSRAARGSGVRGGPKGTRTTFFYNGAFAPFGRSWGAPFAPTELCQLAPTPPPVCVPTDEEPCPSLPPEETPQPGSGPPDNTPNP